MHRESSTKFKHVLQVNEREARERETRNIDNQSPLPTTRNVHQNERKENESESESKNAWWLAPDYDSDRIESIDLFKKSFRDVRSALGNRCAMASRAVLEDTMSATKRIWKLSTHFLVTVIRSCVLR